jgi:hypothetical protein
MSDTGTASGANPSGRKSDTGNKADDRRPPILQLLNSDLIPLCYLCLLPFNPIFSALLYSAHAKSPFPAPNESLFLKLISQ